MTTTGSNNTTGSRSNSPPGPAGGLVSLAEVNAQGLRAAVTEQERAATAHDGARAVAVTATVAYLAGPDTGHDGPDRGQAAGLVRVFDRAVRTWLDARTAGVIADLERERHLGIPAPTMNTSEVTDLLRMGAAPGIESTCWS
jgi:hypothetical protein